MANQKHAIQECENPKEKNCSRVRGRFSSEQKHFVFGEEILMKVDNVIFNGKPKTDNNKM